MILRIPPSLSSERLMKRDTSMWRFTPRVPLRFTRGYYP